MLKLAELRSLEPDNDAQDRLLDELERLAALRLTQLQETIDLRRDVSGDEGFSEARKLVLTRRGQLLMERIRSVFARIRASQRSLLSARETEMIRRSAVTHNSIIIGHCLALALLLLAGAVMQSDRRRRNEVESQLAGSEERLSAIVNSAMDGIITIDHEQRIVIMNPAAEEMFGWERRSLVGQGVDRLVPPQQRDAVARHIRQFAASPLDHRRVGDGGPVVGLRRDGSQFPIEATVSKTQVDGQQLLTIMLRDVSEREASKRQIREQSAVLDQVRDAIQVRDLDDAIVYWNRGSERLYGWSAEQAIGRHGAELMSPPALAESEEPRQSTLAQESWVGELSQRTKSGREILVEQRRTLIRDETGAPAAQLIIAIDVTERRRAEAQQRRLAAPAEHRHAGRRHRPRPEQRAHADPDGRQAPHPRPQAGEAGPDRGDDRIRRRAWRRDGQTTPGLRRRRRRTPRNGPDEPGHRGNPGHPPAYHAQVDRRLHRNGR